MIVGSKDVPTIVARSANKKTEPIAVHRTRDYQFVEMLKYKGELAGQHLYLLLKGTRAKLSTDAVTNGICPYTSDTSELTNARLRFSNRQRRKLFH